MSLCKVGNKIKRRRWCRIFGEVGKIFGGGEGE